MLGMILVLFLGCFFVSFTLGTLLAHLTWTPPIQGVK
jgi:hypothetical protein